LLWKQISKDDLVLTCGVAFLEIEWTSGSLFYWQQSQSNKISYYLLSNEISNLLDEIPRAVLHRVVFHQDGAIPHNAHMNFVFLNHLNYVGEQWMGAHGAIWWPARSPDLNPLDFFIFNGNFLDNVYLTPPGTQKKLKKG
jgi:hypothetical protein